MDMENNEKDIVADVVAVITVLCAVIVPIIILMIFSSGQCVFIIFSVIFIWSLIRFIFG